MKNVRETVLDDVDEVTELSEPILSAALEVSLKFMAISVC